MLKYDIQFKE